MGKHEAGYARVERDLYPTPPWVVTRALAEHVELAGLTAWEPASGNGNMAAALRHAGCARVYATDIVDYGNGQDEVLDFLSAQNPKLERFDLLVTNRPSAKPASSRPRSSRPGCRGYAGMAACWHCCCPVTLIPPRRGRATSAIVWSTTPRSC